MNTEKIAEQFITSIKQQLVKEVLEELRPAIAVEIDQRRLSISEASHYTGMSEDTLTTLCKEKQIPHYRVGSATSRKPRILFRIDSLDKWMLQQEKANCQGWE